MKIVTIIPARGGSKSIPKKNIMKISHKPLIAYSIEYSLRCPLVNRTIVSTDDYTIARLAKRYGAEVPFIRPKRIAMDTTPDFPVLRHALRWLKKNENYKPDILITLHPTSPLRPPRLIERAVDLLKKHPHADSVRSVALCSQHPYRMWKINSVYMRPALRVKNQFNLVRQRLPLIYFQSGDIEAIRYNTIIKLNSITGKNVLPLVINSADMFDIDSMADLRRARKAV